MPAAGVSSQPPAKLLAIQLIHTFGSLIAADAPRLIHNTPEMGDASANVLAKGMNVWIPNPADKDPKAAPFLAAQVVSPVSGTQARVALRNGTEVSVDVDAAAADGGARVVLARDHVEIQRRARMELMQILDSARVDVTRAHLARHYPKRVKKLITTLGEDDKKFDAEVKALPEAERERAVLAGGTTSHNLGVAQLF